jgi:hypothetical protein
MDQLIIVDRSKEMENIELMLLMVEILWLKEKQLWQLYYCARA